MSAEKPTSPKDEMKPRKDLEVEDLGTNPQRVEEQSSEVKGGGSFSCSLCRTGTILTG